MVIAAPLMAWYYNQVSSPLLHFCWNFANILSNSLSYLCSSCEIICRCKSANIYLIPFAICFLVATTDRFEVKLTNTCWGNVNVCVNGKCEGVCADAWTDKKSVMLCENLGCGNRNLPKLPTTTNQSQKVFYKSLHTTHHTTNLSQCNFVKYDENDNTCNTEPASVVCSGKGLISKYSCIQKHIFKYDHN